MTQPAHAPARREMLEEDAPRLILRLCAPSVLAMLASSLGALFDALLVSRSGAAMTAAVGVSFPLLAALQAIGFTLGMGAGSFISRSLGRGDAQAARQAASCALIAALALSAALGALGFCFSGPLLRLLGATDAVLAPGVLYARYVLLGGPLLCASLVLSSLLRGQGRAWPNCFAYAGGSAVGLLVCWLLVARRGMGLHGAGIAFLAREGVTLLALALFMRRGELRPCARLFTLRPAMWADIMRSGVPTLLRQGLISVCGVLLSRASGAFGETALAGMSLAVRALSPVTSAVIGFGQGFQPVCGFATGARDFARVRRAYRFCQTVACAALAAVGAALFCFAPALLLLTGAQAEVAAFGARVLRAQAPVLFAQGAVILMNMLTQSMGQTVRASFVATSRQGYVFLPLLLLLPRLWGETGLVLVQSVSDLISLPLCLLLTRGAIPENAPRRAAARFPALAD